MSDARRPAWTPGVPRVSHVLLVLAVVLGLCAMHVLAAAVSQHRTSLHGVNTAMSPTAMSPTAMSPTAMSPTAMSPTAMSPTAMSPTAMSPTAMSLTAMSPVDQARQATPRQAVDHEHHHGMGDCVPFLSAGLALLMILLAWVVARALRSWYRLPQCWLVRTITATPWRGPPPWRWPRVSLCVIRV